MSLKFKSIAAIGALIGTLALAGCGQEEKDPNHIKIGVIVGAEQQVAEIAQKVAKEKYGLDVELDDILYKLRTVTFKTLPFLCSTYPFIGHRLTTKLILTNSRFYIGKPSARGKNDKKHATKTMKLDAMGFL